VADFSQKIAAVAPRLKAAPLYADAQKAGLDNPEWGAASVRFLIVRLSPFRDAARSTGHLFLHKLIRNTLGGEAYIDFSFFPSKADRAVLDAANIPWLSGIDAKRTAEDYDAVLVSCSYALELVNLPLLLLRSGISLRSSVRRLAVGAAPFPPIILGGSNALASQGLIFPDGDSFVDGIFFGEGEDGGARLISTLAKTKGSSIDDRMDRTEGDIDAFWASCRGTPEEPRKDGKVRLIHPGRCAISQKPLLLDSYPLLNSEEASTARLQISWGCPSFCSFCFEGWERKPYRELPKEQVLETARKLKRESGASTVDLYSFNFNAHQDSLDLIFELNGIFDRVNMMSQRADLLLKTSGMIACELAAEKRSFTVGVEGVSSAMRAFYSKDLTTSDLFALMERLVKEKVRELKLFYILSGNETDGDLAEFRSFCAQLRALADDWHPGLRALFSFGYLVRMPFTPLRAEELVLNKRVFQELSDSAKDAVETYGFEFRLASDWDEYVADQLLVSGSYALAEGLLAAAGAGCAFDLRVEGDLNARLIAALRKSGELDAGQNNATLSGPLIEAKSPDYRYPLSFVETAASAAFRDKAYENAIERVDTRSCLGDNGGSCLGCSACADEAERAFLVNHRVKPAPGIMLADKITARIRDKRKRPPRYLTATLPGFLSGAENEFLCAYLLRQTFKYSEGLEKSLFRMEEVVRNSAEWKDKIPLAATGAAIIALHGTEELDAEAAARSLSLALGTPTAIIDDFQVSNIVGMDVTVDLRDESAVAGARVRQWITSLHIAVTERKTDTGRSFEVSPKDKKKRVLETAALNGSQLTVTGGIKLDLSSLLPKAEDRASAKVTINALRFGTLKKA